MNIKLIALALIGLTLAGCGNQNANQTENNDTKNETSNVVLLNDIQQQFILGLSATYPKPFLISNTFRNRHINKGDIKGLKAFNQKYPDIIFDTTSLNNKDLEILADTNKTHNNLYWVNDKDIYTCKNVVRDMWPCFKNRYQHQAFYYFSVPTFSTDGKYALVSLNYVSANDEESYGGLRVFMFEKDKWEEFAVLNNWGNMPE
ncbi:MAG: hypothetical protein ACK44D_06180 [Bacteroidia bacterium]